MVNVDRMSSAIARAHRVVGRRCAAGAASIAGLARKVIFSRVPAASVGGDFVEAEEDGVVLHL